MIKQLDIFKKKKKKGMIYFITFMLLLKCYPEKHRIEHRSIQIFMNNVSFFFQTKTVPGNTGLIYS